MESEGAQNVIDFDMYIRSVDSGLIRGIQNNSKKLTDYAPTLSDGIVNISGLSSLIINLDGLSIANKSYNHYPDGVILTRASAFLEILCKVYPQIDPPPKRMSSNMTVQYIAIHRPISLPSYFLKISPFRLGQSIQEIFCTVLPLA